jgi:DNA-binding response OmpR family regulator
MAEWAEIETTAYKIAAVDMPDMNAVHQVLLVEDDPVIAHTLALSLRYEGFELAIAASAAQARQALEAKRFDLVMFDVGLPDGNGLDLCRSLRERDAAVPILMLSARTDEATVVAGITGGADDYIRKPYGLAELTARMRRLLVTRGQRSATAETVRDIARDIAKFGPLSLDVARRSAAAGEVALQLGKKEYEVLLLLVRAGGDTVTREQILDSFEGNSEVYDRTIDSHLSHLRRKLKDAGAAVRIVAVYGIGYKLEAA